MTSVEDLKGRLRAALLGEFLAVPPPREASRRVHLEVFRTQGGRHVAVEFEHAEKVNLWVTKLHAPRGAIEGVTPTQKRWNGAGWTDDRDRGANSNLKAYEAFRGRPIMRFGVTTQAQASAVLRALTENAEGAAGRLSNRPQSFLVKIDGSTAAPAGIAKPKAARDWESGRLLAPRPNLDEAVQVGDRLYVWSNEQTGGEGLTAVARVASIGNDSEGLAIEIAEVDLLDRPISFDRLNGNFRGIEVLRRIDGYRPRKTWSVSDEDRDGLDGLIEELGRDPARQAMRDEAEQWQAALTGQADRIAAAQHGLRKLRPDQAAFRKAAMERHGGRCVITGCRVLEALEAAHVIPHTGEPMFERPDNALVLRRDVHALFDAGLIAIDPTLGTVAIAIALYGTPYEKLERRVVKHQLADAPLQYQIERLQAPNP